MAFTLESARYDGFRVARLTGEIDNTVSDEFKSKLMERKQGEGPDLIVDLSEADYLDSSAVGVLVGIEGRLSVRDGLLAIVIPPGNLRRLFQSCGLESEMALFSDVDEALAWMRDSTSVAKKRRGTGHGSGVLTSRRR